MWDHTEEEETFDKFKDGTAEIEGMTEVVAFTIGFKLDLRLTAEAFISNGQNLIDE